MHPMEGGANCRWPEGHKGKCSPVVPTVYDEIRAERKKQDAEWGGPAHDDKHTKFNWWNYIKAHNDRAIGGQARDDFRYQMIRVAALAVAAIQSHDRIKRKEKE